MNKLLRHVFLHQAKTKIVNNDDFDIFTRKFVINGGLVVLPKPGSFGVSLGT